MPEIDRDKEDGDRAEAVLKRALELTAKSLIPMEIIMLITFLHGEKRLRPDDAVCTAYLLGRCGGDIEELEKLPT